MSLDRSMRSHPAGKGIPVSPEVAAMVSAAQDEQALELANRGHYQLEDWAGGPLRRANEIHHELSTGRHAWWVNVAAPLAIVLVFFLLVFGVAALGSIAGGWPW